VVKSCPPSVQSNARKTNFINGLHCNDIRGDIYAGITAGVVALPLALAFGVSSGVGPMASHYGVLRLGQFISCQSA
jgi:SulP family sulfate permease